MQRSKRPRLSEFERQEQALFKSRTPKSRLDAAKKIEVIQYFEKYRPTYAEAAKALKVSITTVRDLYLAAKENPNMLKELSEQL